MLDSNKKNHMDFLYTNSNSESRSMTDSLASALRQRPSVFHELAGDWGSLAISVEATKCNTLSTRNHLVILIGTPVSYRTNGTEGLVTKTDIAAIAQGVLSGASRWMSTLSGPFAILIIDPRKMTLTIATDPLAFIPVYVSNYSDQLVVSTHVDAAANAKSSVSRDRTSIADFILHGIVTYPYTLYEDIQQVPPGSITTIDLNNVRRISSKHYWLPMARNPYSDVAEAAQSLREGTLRFLRAAVQTETNTAQFLSGGEDSRVLAGLLTSFGDKNPVALTYVDTPNRESQIATKVAQAYGLEHQVIKRHPQHYIQHLSGATANVGSVSQFIQAHSYGIQTDPKLESYGAIFGGWSADAFLKAMYARQTTGPYGFPVYPHRLLAGETRTSPIIHELFSQERLAEVRQRRVDHMNRVLEFRTDSCHEWFMLWPASMRATSGQFHSNRRLFRSIEPFISHEVLRLSASVPTSWKMGRRLFHEAFREFLEPSKWIPHASGYYPYRLSPFNAIVSLPRWMCDGAMRAALRYGLRNSAVASWSNWHGVMRSERWKAAVLQASKGYKFLPIVSSEDEGGDLLNDRSLSVHQKLNALQVATFFAEG
ncbi:asparagine synthase-related protein [Pseudactinotalea sp. Z1748]|uniref:asparagine synthase-related protein n=1 Tax=Pseudactinotalea sp. Z1748 TaxID=3413027 RepID=UPI003C7EB06B